MGIKKKKHPQAWKNREMRTLCVPSPTFCAYTQSQTQIWTHVKTRHCRLLGWFDVWKSEGASCAWSYRLLVWAFDINAVSLSSRSSLIFKCGSSRSCSCGCTTNFRMLISSEQTSKMQQNNQGSLPPAGEGGDPATLADASRIRSSQLVVGANRHEWPRATAADSPVSAWGVCGLFQSSRNHQRPSAHLWRHHVDVKPLWPPNMFH